MRHNPIFDRLYGLDGINPFGNPYDFQRYLEFQGYELTPQELLSELEHSIEIEDYLRAADIARKINALRDDSKHRLEGEEGTLL